MIRHTLIHTSLSDREYRHVIRESLFENVILNMQGQDRTAMEFLKKSGVVRNQTCNNSTRLACKR